MSREERIGREGKRGGIALAVRPRYGLLGWPASGCTASCGHRESEGLGLMWWIDKQYLRSHLTSSR